MPNVIILTPNNPEYDVYRLSWNARYDVYPQAIFQPLNEKGVQETLAMIQKTGQPFSIKSGGHCAEPWSLTSGTLIDLSQMAWIDLQDDVVSIGPGAILKDVYSTLVEQGRMIPTGVCPTVGVGGQALNGGFGYSTRYRGLLTDSILSYRIVLADGSIRTVSKNLYPDLFWALRGSGAGNFGVVVGYRIQTYPADCVTVFKYNYSFDDRYSTLKWLTRINKPKQLTCNGFITSNEIQITGQCYGYPDDLLKLISDLPPPQTTELRYVSFEEAVAYWTNPTTYSPFKSKSRELSRRSIDILVSSVQRIIENPDVRYVVDIQQLRGKAYGSIPWKRSQYWVYLSLKWPEGYQIPEPAGQILEETYLQILENADPWSYMGMMDTQVGPPNYRKAFYGDYCKLRQIKQKYDPCSFFNYPQGLARR